MTCEEAAEIFRKRAEASPYQAGMHRLNAMAEVLSYFGDDPVPEELVRDFRLDSGKSQ